MPLLPGMVPDIELLYRELVNKKRCDLFLRDRFNARGHMSRSPAPPPAAGSS